MAKDAADDGWFEVSDRDWIPQFKAKHLKLLADAQVPEPIVREIGSAGIAIKAMSAKWKRSSDQTVLQLAQREGRVLLTLDADFWDDRQHPQPSSEESSSWPSRQKSTTAFCAHSAWYTDALPEAIPSIGGAI